MYVHMACEFPIAVLAKLMLTAIHYLLYLLSIHTNTTVKLVSIGFCLINHAKSLFNLAFFLVNLS